MIPLADVVLGVILLVASAYGIVRRDWRGNFAGVGVGLVWLILLLIAHR